MDNKSNEREQKHQAVTGQVDAHLLVIVSEAPSRMENVQISSTPTSGIGALAVNSPPWLVIADDPEPNGSSKSLPNQNMTDGARTTWRGCRLYPNLLVCLGMAGTPEVSPTRDARLLEVNNPAYSGLLARVLGSPDPRAMRASRSSRVGGGAKGQPEGALAVHGILI
eukprot:2793457-Pleurochrysis_carterae.AAC.1